MTVLKIILALLNGIPILDSWFRKLQLEYVKRRVEANDVEYFEALKAVVDNQSTIALQKHFGKMLE